MGKNKTKQNTRWVFRHSAWNKRDDASFTAVQLAHVLYYEAVETYFVQLGSCMEYLLDRNVMKLVWTHFAF